MKSIRLVLKLHRFEVTVLGMVLIGLAIGSLFVAVRIGAAGSELSVCQDPVTCMRLQEDLVRLKVQSGALFGMGLILPVFAGVILGVPIVARDVERGTASLTWTMSRSRQTWFLWRVSTMAIVLAVLSLPAAVALDALSSAMHPGWDVGRSFLEAAMRGPVVVARAVTALTVASLAGAILGRVIPGLLVALVTCAAVLLALQVVNEALLRSDANPLPTSASLETAYVADVGYLLPSGRVVDWDAAWAALGDSGQSPDEVFPRRYIGLPGEAAPAGRAREIGLILLAGLAAAAAAVATVNRRRPY